VLTLTKILSLLVYPLSLGLLFLLISLLAGMVGRRGFSWLMALMGFLIIYLPATLFGSNALVAPLEARHPAFSPEELPEADAIVLLGGASDGESRFGRGGDLNNGADRLTTAAELYLAGKAPVILISGGAEPGQIPEAELLAQILKGLRIPPSAILLEPNSRTTYDNAVMSGELLKNAGYSHILLVTSGVHMRRAITLFQNQGLQVTGAATDHQIPKFQDSLVPGWLPTYYRLARSSRAIHEWVGYFVYDLTGKL
jgi:uncharacterized SAM-binding protein YcdF (DUF218 family)